MVARIRIDVRDDAVPRIDRAVRALGPGAETVFDAIGTSLRTSTVKRFEEEKTPDGDPWPPSQRVLLKGGQTLTDTARLRNSITHVATAEQVEVGTNVVYAAIHQFGSGDLEKPKNIPERPFLGIDDDDRNTIERLFVNALEAAV